MIDRYSLSPMKDLWTDQARFESWLEVELAVCECWAASGRIPPADLKRIRKRARVDTARIAEIEATTRHDVIAFTTQLAEAIGPSSRFVHIGLTSSDVVDTALGLRLARTGEILAGDLAKLDKTLSRLARKHAHDPMMGRTHGMHAEPTTFGLKVLVWREEFRRQAKRLEAAVREVAVGKISGAVGTGAHTGPRLEHQVCRRLGLALAPVSTQVVQRDRHAHFVSALALIGASVEKVATEVRNLQRPEIRELEEPFAKGQKGSSAMPHKRNPVQCEQLCGLARVLRGHSTAALEDVALWGERDISHSSVERIVLADACLLADYMLRRIEDILDKLTVNTARMLENIGVTRGLIYSQSVLLRLVECGIAREEAYAAVQAAAMRCWHGRETFIEELMRDAALAKLVDRKELERVCHIEPFLKHVPAIFKRCGIKLRERKKRGRKKHAS
ncbi:adenylosuccinate lyase [Candidatus Poribacteria bacterium]|nr:adenylosuccinate lyase [Candidatus Poribacteria bacterium]